METLFKFNYRNHVGVRIEVIYANDIEEGRDLAQRFCDLQAFKLIDICPFVFPIKEYLELSNNGKSPQGKPENFGQYIERRKLQEKREAEADAGKIIYTDENLNPIAPSEEPPQIHSKATAKK